MANVNRVRWIVRFTNVNVDTLELTLSVMSNTAANAEMLGRALFAVSVKNPAEWTYSTTTRCYNMETV